MYCTYNVTLKRIRATIVAVKSNEYYTTCVCICRLSYPACNSYAPYYHLWPASLYYIIPHYLINGMISEKKVIERMMSVSSFSTNFFEIFLILRRTERAMIENVHWSSCDVCFILVSF
jgi:hypothetical protein